MMRISNIVCVSLISGICFCNEACFAQWISDDEWFRDSNATSASSGPGGHALFNEFGETLPLLEFPLGGTFDFIRAKTYRTAGTPPYGQPTGTASISGTNITHFTWMGNSTPGALTLKGVWSVSATTTHGVYNGASGHCEQNNPTTPGAVPTVTIVATHSNHPNPQSGTSNLQTVPNGLSLNAIDFYFKLSASANGTSSSYWLSEGRSKASAYVSN